MRVFFDHIERESATIATFFFRPERPLRYDPGQFAELYIPHEADNYGERRIFTLTSLPSDPLLSMTVRLPDLHTSYKQALMSLEPGTPLAIDNPLGDFVLPKDSTVPLVWASGGVGSAAFVGMAKALATEPVTRKITFFQSARSANELLFGDTWRQAKLEVYQAVTRENQHWPGRKNRFTVNDLMAAAGAQPADTMFYLSGPELMVEELASGLKAQGIRTDYIVREAFTGH